MERRRIFRIVHIDNLEMILRERGMWCGKEAAVRHPDYKQIGLQDLTRNRGSKTVGVGPLGTLSDYVPFYFCARSVMLFQIHSGQVPTFTEGQEPVIHLVSSVERIQSYGLGFAFSDRHAKLRYAKFYDRLEDLDRLDWPTIRSKSFGRTEDDPDRPARKEAEFLVHRFMPWECIEGIGVFSKKWKDRAEQTLAEYGHSTRVKTMTSWYY